MAPPSPAGVLLDVDGTLVDTTYVHAVSWWQALRQFGLTMPTARIHRAIGMGSDQILEHLLGDDRDRADDPGISAAHTAIAATYWPALRTTPGARELIGACASHGLTVVLASSAEERELAVLRRVIDADEHISEVTTADDVRASKPAPDVIEVALAKAGLAADRTVFVGDAVWDVHACRRARVQCVGVTCGGTSAAELREAGAVAVYDDPAGLLAALDEAILARLGTG